MAEKQAGMLETPEWEDGGWGALKTCRICTAATWCHHPGASGSLLLRGEPTGRKTPFSPSPVSHLIHFPKCKRKASNSPGDIDFLKGIHSGRKNESEKPGSDLWRPLSIEGRVDESTSALRMSAPWGPFLKQEPTEGRLPRV